MINWKTLKKIDAHIHILPDDVHEANPDSEDVWLFTDIHQYSAMMDNLGIEKAVIMPLNDPWLMSMEFTVDAVHKNLYEMKQQYPGRFYAFADIDTRNDPATSVQAIRRAIEEYHLDGIKIHPNNNGIRLDSNYYEGIFSYAQESNVPVAIHCYPNSEEDFCTAQQVVSIIEQYPKLTVIVSHMGAYQWHRLLPTSVYVDISAILPDYVREYGIQKTNEILRQFGPARLIFTTDYPDSRILQPEDIYESYLTILTQMDFSHEEAENIAYSNIDRILSLHQESTGC